MAKRQRDPEEQLSYDKWYAQQSDYIKTLVDKYPPDEKYVMGEGTPYGVAVPGTKVEIIGYRESGEVTIMIKSMDKLPLALEYERKMGDKFFKTSEEIAREHRTNVKVFVDPKYLTKL